MTETICQRPNVPASLEGLGILQSPVNNGLAKVVLRVGTPRCSSRCHTWHPLTFHDHMGGLIDCIDSEGLSGLGPLHWTQAGSFQSVAALDNPGFFISNIIRASSLHVISGLLPAGEQVLWLTRAIFLVPCWETQPCWQIKPPSDRGKGERAPSGILFKAHRNVYVAESRVTFEGMFQTWRC